MSSILRLRVVVVLSVALAVGAQVAPASASAGSAPAAATRPAPLQFIPDLLSALLPGLFPPPAVPGITRPVLEQAVASTVRVSGPACGRLQVGSGFSPRADTAVTAAHVVAGTSRVEVLKPDGQRLPASVVVFDPNRDLAVLRVNGLGQSPLPLARASTGTAAAVLGHPRGQVPVDISPATVVAQGVARISNLYGEGPFPREILRLSSRLEPGDSGGPVVDGLGNVVGVAFGVATLRPDVAFAVSSREVETVLSQPATSAVSTGPCID